MHKVLVGNKELDILAMIFDDNADIYNYRFSKNTPDIEVRTFTKCWEILIGTIGKVIGIDKAKYIWLVAGRAKSCW